MSKVYTKLEKKNFGGGQKFIEIIQIQKKKREGGKKIKEPRKSELLSREISLKFVVPLEQQEKDHRLRLAEEEQRQRFVKANEQRMLQQYAALGQQQQQRELDVKRAAAAAEEERIRHSRIMEEERRAYEAQRSANTVVLTVLSNGSPLGNSSSHRVLKKKQKNGVYHLISVA